VARLHRCLACVLLLVIAAAPATAQKRLAIIDQDGDGPAETNQMSMLALLQSPQVEVLGITIVTGNAWRDAEVQHTLRMLELTNHTTVPVVPGAVFPLVRTLDETRIAMRAYGKPAWLGAWGRVQVKPSEGTAEAVSAVGELDPWAVPPLREGMPHTKPADEDAAHFIIRQVHAHPGQVTIFALGPLTNIAIAIAIDPKLPEITRGLVVMGGSINPQTSVPEIATAPQFEFNFWLDPEAAHTVLRAKWPRVDVTTQDVSIKALFTDEMFAAVSQSKAPAAQYIAKFAKDRYYQWDELAVCSWLAPSVITRSFDVYMDVDTSHGPHYGHTLTWMKELKPETDVRLVHAHMDLDLPKFRKMFVELMSK